MDFWNRCKEFFRKRKQAQQQPQTGSLAGRILYRCWMIAFTAFKVALGAVCTVALIVFICLFVFADIVGDYLEGDIMPNAEISLDEYDMELKSTLYCVDNGQIEVYQDIFAVINREMAYYEDIPEDLINAAIAIEDHRFYEHQGVDWITTSKAIVRMFFGNDDAGGSSITQQLVKNHTGESGVTVQRKVLEIFRATHLEKHYSKEEIMEAYLNRIYLGQSCWGVRTAAGAYFGKELEKLTLAECAALISITNSPTYYDPYQNFENNAKRKEDVLWSMLNYDLITQEEYDEALDQPIVLKWGIDFEDSMAQCVNPECNYKDIVRTLNTDGVGYYCPKCGQAVPVEKQDDEGVYSWYTDTVLEDVAKALADQDGAEWNDATKQTYKLKIQHGGYKIYTCIDLDVQAQVDRIYQDLSQIPDTRSGQQLQSAIVVKDNRTGDIIAMAGGVGPDKEFDDWNRATDANLQSGSSIKPLSVYGPAFEVGAITPATVIKDLPLNYNVYAYGPYPRNDNFTYSYAKTIYSGVVNSTNAICANTLQKITTDVGFDFAKNKFNLTSLMEDYTSPDGVYMTDNGYGPLAMGAQTWGVKVRDMADAFHTYANEGVYVRGRTFSKVYDSKGNLVLDNPAQARRIISEKTVDYMNYCLQEAADTGTGWEADLSESLGIATYGKTGSTSSFKDRWFCGFTGYYTAAVWTGYDSPERIYLTGGGNNPAAILFRKVMEPLHYGLQNKVLYDESRMVGVTMCLDSGKVATSACGKDVRSISRTASAKTYREDRPGGVCTKHVMVEYCDTGNGVATEFCKHFAEVDETVKITSRSLVKMTRAELEEILRASGYGLASAYTQDNYVYLVDGNGKDGDFKGFYNNKNKDVKAPYIVCPVHTEKAWQDYENSYQEDPENPNPGNPGFVVP